MDWLFNLQIPKSSEARFVIRPLTKTFVTGIALEYGARFDSTNRLCVSIGDADLQRALVQINDCMRRYWPCPLAFWAGYILAPLTLGLSLLIPNLCIADGEKALLQTIGSLNRLKFRDKGLEIVYTRGFMTAWIEVVPYHDGKKQMSDQVDDNTLLLTNSV